MSGNFALLVGLLVAALVPATMLAVFAVSPTEVGGLNAAVAYGVVSFFVAGAHVIVLDLPLVLLGAKLGRISILTAFLFGFAVGAGPTAAAYWPLAPSLGVLVNGGADVFGWHGAPLRISGALTSAAWVAWARSVMLTGLLGAAGAMGFVLVWQRRSAAASDPGHPEATEI